MRTFAVGLLTLGGGQVLTYGQVIGYESYHSAAWFQTTPSPVFDRSNALHFYAARLRVSSDLDADAATVTVTGAAGSILLTPGLDPTVLEGATGFYPDQTLFDTDFPPGAEHVFTITSGNLLGESGAILHPDPLSFPDTVPAFTAANFSTFGAVDVNAATFEWNLWAATPPAPSALFFAVWEGGNLVLSEAIPDTSTTTYAVAPGVLTPGSTYRAEIVFSSRIDSGLGTWPGTAADGFAGYDFRTSAEFTTVPEPHCSAVLAGVALLGFVTFRRRKPSNGIA